MDIRWQTLFADVPAGHVDAGLTFWASITASSQMSPQGERDELLPLSTPGGDSALWLQRVDRPDGGWHLDLHVADLDDAVRTALALGASATRTVRGLVTMSSPGGQPFCFVTHTRERQRPALNTWSGGHRSLLDQVCLDIPFGVFDDECRFWSELTGWERRRGTRPEFDDLHVPAELPLRILLQRLGGDDGGPTRAHADLACDDVVAECRRHERLGAVVTRVAEHWTTLLDPAGLEYCVTDREPGPVE